MIKRIIWIVLDSVGMGELPDADIYGDVGSNTLGNIYKKNGGLELPNLIKLGLSNIEGMKGFKKITNPIGAFARVAEMSKGKDTTIGHWEMIGIYSKVPFPTYESGFPKEIINEFIKRAKIPGILGNKVASGTDILIELADEHIKKRMPIIYTSADSVFQIACHEEVYSIDELYNMCQIARELLVGEHEVARVIARPFVGQNNNWTRTSNRRDFSKTPPENNLLVNMKEMNMNVVGIGKIEDIFAGEGITKAIHTKDNEDGMDVTLKEMKKTKEGLIFTNLVEFDSKWGHRNDYKGYAKGLEQFDIRLKEVLDNLLEDDLLIITADHGCDPTTISTDHSREYVPLVIYGNQVIPGTDLKTLSTFSDIGQTISEIFNLKKLDIGTSFLEKIIKVK